MRCSALQCVAVCCTDYVCRRAVFLLGAVNGRCVAGVVQCCSMLQSAAVCCSVLQCVAVWCNVLQCGAVWCSVLHCGAVCHSVVQCVVVMTLRNLFYEFSVSQCVVCFFRAVRFGSLFQCVGAYCSVLQCVAVRCSALQACHTVLEHTIPPLLATAQTSNERSGVQRVVLQCVAVCCSVLQCVAVCCSVLQCVA